MPKGYVIDEDTTDEFLDKPDLVYREPDGQTSRPFTEDELDRIGELYPKSRLKVPPSPDR
jgi:hypothetical protein